MDFSTILLGALTGADLQDLAEDAAREAVKAALLRHFEKQAPRVARQMKRWGDDRIGEAAYHLWKSVVKSGEAANLIRDGQRRALNEMIGADIADTMPNPEVARRTGAAIVELVF